ncbi:hypothetical protein BVZ74_01330B, partial [Haemophilus influenzae]
ILINL